MKQQPIMTRVSSANRMATLERKQQETINPVLRRKLAASITTMHREEKKRKRAILFDKGRKTAVSLAGILGIAITS